MSTGVLRLARSAANTPIGAGQHGVEHHQLVVALGGEVAVLDGVVMPSEFTPEAPFVSTLSRAEVRIQAIAARDAGQIAIGEALVLPTPAQLVPVRLAGLRAVKADNLAQGMNKHVTN